MTFQGTLLLGRSSDAAHMLESYYTQEQMGARTRLYRGKKLARTFPWLNTSDIEMASFSLENEGFFDSKQLLEALRRKNTQLGIKFVKGEVVGFKPIGINEDTELTESFNRNTGHRGKSYATIVTPSGKLLMTHYLLNHRFLSVISVIDGVRANNLSLNTLFTVLFWFVTTSDELVPGESVDNTGHKFKIIPNKNHFNKPLVNYFC